ncbi:MAG: hypothetical protein AAFT19_09925 [Pseudomonadota bacterium]
MTGDAIVWSALAVIALTASTVALRLIWARQTADLVLLLQLLSAKAIGVFFLFGVLYDLPAFAEIALSISLLGAVVAAVYAYRRPS